MSRRRISTGNAMHLTALDFVAIGVPFVAILAVALSMRRYMRSVADFLAANRCAGRYLICTSLSATGSSVLAMVTALEVFSKTGFSLTFWNTFTSLFFFFFGLLGLIVFRFRETRALTFHQLFEVRYSRGVRVFSSFLHVFSGLFNFGVAPAVGARFFVYFCGMPAQLPLGSITIPTYVPVMLVLMGVSLCFALTGGQISVMVTDCLEGVISSVFYLIVAGYIVLTLSVAQMRGALLSGDVGKSYIDPFDIGGQGDFNGWFVVLGMLYAMYTYRGNAWNQGFAAAAKTAHEGRMATILSNWRIYSYTAMSVLVSIAAFTMLHHPDFSAQQAQVQQGLKEIDVEQLRTQMTMPMALGLLLAPGVRGCFLAVLLFGLLASQGAELHRYGATILQDVILPLRTKPLAARGHMLALKATVFFVAVFACTFSILYSPPEYLQMIAALIGVIYLGGIGLVCWGGLYWKKGTTAGAWAALSIGGGLGVIANIIQPFWKHLNPIVVRWLGPGQISDYLLAHPARSPLNGLQLAVIISGLSAVAYVVVSLLTCRQDFNMDAMLHRGRYRVETQEDPAADALSPGLSRKSLLYRLLNIDEHFSRGDKALTIGTFVWTMLWKVLALGILIWTLCVAHLSKDWWFDYTMITGVWLTLVVAVIVTIWFTIGVARDLADLFRTLNTAQRDDADDGTVRDGQNAGEPPVAQAAEARSCR